MPGSACCRWHRVAHPSETPFSLSNRKRILLHWHQGQHSLPNQVSEVIFITHPTVGCVPHGQVHTAAYCQPGCVQGRCFPFSFLTYTSDTLCKFYLVSFGRKEGKSALLSSGLQPSWLEKRKMPFHSKCRQQDQRCLFCVKCWQTCLTNLAHTTSGFRLPCILVKWSFLLILQWG